MRRELGLKILAGGAFVLIRVFVSPVRGREVGSCDLFSGREASLLVKEGTR